MFPIFCVNKDEESPCSTSLFHSIASSTLYKKLVKSKQSNKKIQINEKTREITFYISKRKQWEQTFHARPREHHGQGQWRWLVQHSGLHVQSPAKISKTKNVKWARIKNKIKFPTKILSQFQNFSHRCTISWLGE